MMSYQLEDGWTSVNFVRPIKNLLILHGIKILKISLLGFEANNKSLGHRFESKEKKGSILENDELFIFL